jgi:drug/metabolite transporter (DMT)-like permease
MSVDMVRLLQIVFALLVVVAGSLVWARENGHSPLKAAPVWIGFAVLAAVVYVLDQQFSGNQSYADLLNREAMLTTVGGWIIAASVAGLSLLFILRMLSKRFSNTVQGK